jgi:hypothetical protein
MYIYLKSFSGKGLEQLLMSVYKRPDAINNIRVVVEHYQSLGELQHNSLMIRRIKFCATSFQNLRK